jgi:hypothetical protein
MPEPVNGWKKRSNFLNLYISIYFSQRSSSKQPLLSSNKVEESYLRKMFVSKKDQKKPTYETERITEFNIAIICKFIINI